MVASPQVAVGYACGPVQLIQLSSSPRRFVDVDSGSSVSVFLRDGREGAQRGRPAC